MAKKEYQRLTRARSKLAVAVMSRTSLWLASDHLLLVDSSGYAEKYKRFYFRDIQALVLQRTARNFNWNIGFGVALLLFAVIALANVPYGTSRWTDGEVAGVFFLGVIIAILTLLLVINVVRGATCKCFLRTAVQIEELPSLSRVRRAQKIFAKLHPFIAAAQGGELSAEMISAQMQEPAAPPVMESVANETAVTAALAPTSVEETNVPPKMDS